MSKPKDPCKVCPFIRDCIAEGEDKRWCFVRILTLMLWDETEETQRRKREDLRAADSRPYEEDGGGAE